MKTLPRFASIVTLGMSVLSVPSLAIAQPTIDVVGDTAPLIARGAGAIVSVEVTCASPTDPAFANVLVIQRAGNKTTTGFGNIDINCSSTEPVEVVVAISSAFGTPSGRILKEGVALALASVTECNPDFSVCQGAQATKEIRLLRSK
jgi:hypothetical protein